jgi:hypothetical protein
MVRRGIPGTRFTGPLITRSRRAGDNDDVTCEIYSGHVAHRVDWFEDFIGDLSASDLGIAGKLYDLSPAGTPTEAVVANAADGQLELTLAATSEDELAGFSWGDQLLCPSTKRAFWQGRIKIPVLPASAAERIVFGMAGARNNLLNSVTRKAWFRLEANGALLAEVDDGTTFSAQQDCGFTLVADTWYYFSIDMFDTNNISFQLGANDGSSYRQVKTLAGAAFAATDLFQPFCFVQKVSGTGVPSMKIDYLRMSWDRTP